MSGRVVNGFLFVFVHDLALLVLTRLYKSPADRTVGRLVLLLYRPNSRWRAVFARHAGYAWMCGSPAIHPPRGESGPAVASHVSANLRPRAVSLIDATGCQFQDLVSLLFHLRCQGTSAMLVSLSRLPQRIALARPRARVSRDSLGNTVASLPLRERSANWIAPSAASTAQFLFVLPGLVALLACACHARGQRGTKLCAHRIQVIRCLVDWSAIRGISHWLARSTRGCT